MVRIVLRVFECVSKASRSLDELTLVAVSERTSDSG